MSLKIIVKDFLKDKRKPLALGLVLLIAFSFWSMSRYPQLDDKSAMGGRAFIEGLAFSEDVVFPILEEDTLPQRLFFHFVNWSNTNKRGMIFGLLLAGALLTFLSYFEKKRSGDPVKNILKGMMIGVPLGVCVNCATPITQGMIKAGIRVETALATLISSPTLNIIVFSMLFTLLPFHFAVLKIVLTLLFILWVIPFFTKEETSQGQKETAFTSLTETICAPTFAKQDPFFPSLKEVLLGFVKNTFEICKTTVPFMILAGFFGAAMIEFVPLNFLKGLEVNILSLFLTAFVATFVPIPIAFDIILVSVLLQAGLAPEFGMVLLFCLGTFSVYPYLILGRSLRWRASNVLFFSVLIMGFLGGVFIKYYNPYMKQKFLEDFKKLKVEEKKEKPIKLSNRNKENTENTEEIKGIDLSFHIDKEGLKKRELSWEDVTDLKREGLQIKKAAYLKKEQKSGKKNLAQVLYKKNIFQTDFVNERGFVTTTAAVHLNNDDFPEMMVIGPRKALFYTYHKTELKKVGEIKLGKIAAPEDTIFPVDLDNDGDTDFLTNNEKKFVLYENQNLKFKKRDLSDLHYTMTISSSFGYLNDDDLMDIVIGGFNFFNEILGPTDKTSTNRAYLSQKSKEPFRYKSIDLDKDYKTNGATLSSLISFIKGPHTPYLFVGNDFSEPDIYYSFKNGKPSIIKNFSKQIPSAPVNTMSFMTADIDNNGELDLFSTDMMPREATFKKGEECKNLSGEDQLACNIVKRIRVSVQQNDLEGCFQKSEGANKILAEMGKNICLDTIVQNMAVDLWDVSLCEKISSPSKKASCEETIKSNKERSSFFNPKRSKLKDIPKQKWSNILLLQKGGTFIDQTDSLNVARTDWSWNSQFLDINNDGYEDIFVTNGSGNIKRYTPNRLLINQKGKGFKFSEKKWNMGETSHTFSWAKADMDNDGDIDVVTSGPNQKGIFYENPQGGNSITFDVIVKGKKNLPNVKIEITRPDGSIQLKETKIGGGFASFNSLKLHFGLGGVKELKKIRLMLPFKKPLEIKYPFKAGHIYKIIKD